MKPRVRRFQGCRDGDDACGLSQHAGRLVVLVDDVRTTGATLTECEQVLIAMGAREVRSLTLAQAPAPES